MSVPGPKSRKSNAKSSNTSPVTIPKIPDRLQKSLNLRKVEPLTKNQEDAFECYSEGSNLVMLGSAGTGKSFLSLYFAIKEVLDDRSIYEKVVIVRSAVPSRDLGFMPGNLEEKSALYETPYIEIFAELFNNSKAYQTLKNLGQVEFMTTSFIRGTTLRNCIVVVDEIQNCQFSELDTVITRIGKDSKILFCGDFKQTDFQKDYEKNGLREFLKILDHVDEFEFIGFSIEDCVRSGLVRSYLIAKENIEN